MDHTKGDRRINKGKEVVVEKELKQCPINSSSRSNSSNSSSKRSIVDTMSALIIVGITQLVYIFLSIYTKYSRSY